MTNTFHTDPTPTMAIAVPFAGLDTEAVAVARELSDEALTVALRQAEVDGRVEDAEVLFAESLVRLALEVA